MLCDCHISAVHHCRDVKSFAVTVGGRVETTVPRGCALLNLFLAKISVKISVVKEKMARTTKFHSLALRSFLGLTKAAFGWWS